MYLGGAGAVEGVGLQDVSPSFQELIVDASNDVGAGDDQQVIVALQLIRMALVTIPPEVLLTQPVRQYSLSKWPTKAFLYAPAYTDLCGWFLPAIASAPAMTVCQEKHKKFHKIEQTMQTSLCTCTMDSTWKTKADMCKACGHS